MRRRPRKTSDFATRARAIVEQAIGEPLYGGTDSIPTEGKNPHAVAMGRLGGHRGGKARAEKLSPERKREIAQKAAKARWAKSR